jgi:POT family proton-dependent oligopeptide transporter
MALPLVLPVPGVATFYTGLLLIVLGTGLLKPNVSTLVGTLYKKTDERRDAGFSIFYMGINIGATVAPLITSPLGQKVNWHYGFAAAGVGMVLGLIQYVAGRRYLIGQDAPKTEAAAAREEHMDKSVPKEPFTPDEWKRIGVIGILFLFSVLFWMAFEQAGSSLNLFAERYADLKIFGLDIPSGVLQFIQPGFVIVLSPVFAWIWLSLNRRHKEPSSPAKFSVGLVFVGLGMLLLAPAASIAQSKGIRVSVLWLIGVYFLHTVGELCLSPVGLSVVTKLAPPRIAGSMMGVWFLSIAFGNLVAGFAAGMFDRIPLVELFGIVAAITIGAGVLLMLLVRPIKRLMGGVK